MRTFLPRQNSCKTNGFPLLWSSRPPGPDSYAGNSPQHGSCLLPELIKREHFQPRGLQVRFFGFKHSSKSLKIPEENFHQIGTSPAWGLQGLDSLGTDRTPRRCSTARFLTRRWNSGLVGGPPRSAVAQTHRAGWLGVGSAQRYLNSTNEVGEAPRRCGEEAH